MPRIIIKWSTEEPLELKHLIEQFQGIESRLLMGQNMLINFTGSAAEYLPFLQSLHRNAMIESIRELCQGKCRDDSDCLNTVVEGSYCRKHQTVGGQNG